MFQPALRLIVNASTIVWMDQVHPTLFATTKLQPPESAASNAPIEAHRSYADLDVEVLHVTEAAFRKPIGGEVRLDLRHPRLSAIRAEKHVDVWLLVNGDHGRQWQPWTKLSEDASANNTWRKTSERNGVGAGLAMKCDRSEGAGAQDGAPVVVHG